MNGMKGRDLWALQQQSRQLRELEHHAAAQSGRPVRKLTLIERLLGLGRQERRKARRG